MDTNNGNTSRNDFAHEVLRAFFISHLNIIYCGKIHIAEKLPQMVKHADFSDLRNAITEAMEDVKRQIRRMDEIYLLLNATHSLENCNDFIKMIDSAFEGIQLKSSNMITRDLSILFYLQNIESVCVSSFQALQIASVSFNNELITQLLIENTDEAKEDVALMSMIMAKYMQK